MAAIRVLLLGVTGIDKLAVIRHLLAWCVERDYGARILPIDFEGEFLSAQRDGDLTQFLDDAPDQQLKDWRAAWGALRAKYAPGRKGKNKRRGPEIKWADQVDWAAEIVFLSLHATVTRTHYGVRVVVDPRLLAEFRPQAVVTLLADVYDMWWRTEKRARGEAWRGRPTLEHLLTARRVEQAIGLQLAQLMDPPARHYVLSVQHPCEVLHRLIMARPLVVYLSFPISRPRELEKAGDTSGIDDVNGFLRAAYQLQARTENVVFINPLTIDERPLIDRALEGEDRKNWVTATDPDDNRRTYRGLNFDRERYRWPMAAFCQEHELLSPQPPPSADRRPLYIDQVHDVEGLIRTDVGWRDYGLVAQARRLAVFNPVMKDADEPARGVRGEIETALLQKGTVVYYFQAPEHDPQHKFARWVSEAGSTGASESRQRLISCSSVDDLLGRATTP